MTATEIPHPQPPAPRPAYRDANVLRWLAAYAASMIGDGVYFLALGWAAREAAGPAQVGLVMAVGAVPRAVLMLGGGVIADRFGPRRVALGGDAVRCAVILGVAAALVLGSPGLWVLVAAALVFGAVDAVFMPAVGALPPRLTDRSQLARLQGMAQLAVRTGNITGPPLAGLAMGFGGPGGAFGLAGGLFAVSLALLLTVRLAPLPADTEPPGHADPAPGRGGALRDLGDGLRYVVRHPLIGRIVLAGTVCELAIAGPMNVGVVLLAAERGWGAGGTAWLVGAFGVGAAGAALVLAVAGRVPRTGAVMLLGMVLAVAAVAGIGLAPGLGWAVGAAGCAGLAGGTWGGLGRALVQTETAPAMLGRVSSVQLLGAIGVAPLSYPVFGLAAGVWGAGPVFAACACFSLVGVAIAGASSRVRRSELAL